MTTINDMSDLARVLREHPEWRDTVRGLVLGDDLARLPENMDGRMEEFRTFTQRNHEETNRRVEAIQHSAEEYKAENRQRLEAIERSAEEYKAENRQRLEAIERSAEEYKAENRQRLEAIERSAEEYRAENRQRLEAIERSAEEFRELTRENVRHIQQLQSDMQQLHDRMTNALNRLTGRFDNGLGTYYELRVEKVVHSLADRLDLSRVRVLVGARSGFNSQFGDLLDDARRNKIVTRHDLQELLQLDLVFAARTDDGEDVHVAAEVSITAGDWDILRAGRRASSLSGITGQRVIPAVISANVDDDRKELAAQEGVTVMLLSEN